VIEPAEPWGDGVEIRLIDIVIPSRSADMAPRPRIHCAEVRARSASQRRPRRGPCRNRREPQVADRLEKDSPDLVPPWLAVAETKSLIPRKNVLIRSSLPVFKMKTSTPKRWKRLFSPDETKNSLFPDPARLSARGTGMKKRSCERRDRPRKPSVAVPFGLRRCRSQLFSVAEKAISPVKSPSPDTPPRREKVWASKISTTRLHSYTM